MLKRATLGAAVALAAMLAPGMLSAQQPAPFKIGVIDDMSGIVSELGGKGTLIAVNMAVEDYGGKVLGRPIAVVSGEHQNRPDLAATITQEWLEKGGIEVVITGGASNASLSVQTVVKNNPTKTFLVGGSLAPDFSGKACTPNTVQFTANNYTLANPLARVLTKLGKDAWFVMVVDYASGHAAQAATIATVQASGGKIVGSARFPSDATDYSAYILQAQALKPKVLAFAAGGDQGQNIVRTASEFGLVASGTTIAGLSSFITDVHALGLQIAQGAHLAEAFYWDRNERTREFSKRFFARHGKMPTQMQATAYAAISHYLPAVAAVGTPDATKVVSKMKATEVNNAVYQGGVIREDGAYVRPIYVFRVKKPEESKYPWDYYTLVQEVPGEEAFLSLKDHGCPNPTK